MIFSKFFKKKNYLSEKVSDRLQAVAELDAKSADNKSILHELAFNDGDDKVRRAALEKLNDFSLFWQAFKKDSSDAIKKLSEQALLDNLTGIRESNIDPVLKRQFVQECNKTQLLEKVVFKLGDDDLIEQTLVKLNKETLWLQSLQQSELASSLKLNILNHINDPAQLKKLSKKLTGELLAKVEAKLDEIKEAQQQPVRIEKQARLLLAQYNALKDKSDVELVEAKINEFEQQWQAFDLALLADNIKLEVTDKYQAIAGSVQRILAPKKQQWLAEKAQQQQAQLEADNFQQLSQKLTQIEANITQSIVDGKSLAETNITADINGLEKQVAELAITKADKASILSRAESLFNRANQLPMIKQAIETGEDILQQMQQLTLPTDLTSLNQVNPSYKALKVKWQQNLKQLDIALPATMLASFDQLSQEWQGVLKDLEKQQNQLFSQTRRKMSELETLVKVGKFHSAFGLSKKLGYWLEDLNQQQQQQLERKWQALQQQIDNLHELERSFSNPKKQELLQDIKKLAESPLLDPTEQAHRVKLLRSNWLSLGHADDEQEQVLNQEFDQYCEDAFAPCREHYRGLEDEREKNYQAKLLLLDQLKAIAQGLSNDEVQDWRSLESLFGKLTKLWRETGLVDREKVSSLNQEYQSFVKPIRQAINHYHSDNEQLKRKLIAQAEQIANGDDELQQKTQTLKQLQNEWRQIGFAGNKVDQKLWLQFRAVNNPIFEQRENSKKEQQAEAKQQFSEFNQQLQVLKSELESVTQAAELRVIADQADQIFANVSGLAKGDYEQLRKLTGAIKAAVEDKISVLRKQKEDKSFTDLFAAVEQIASGDSADLSELKPAWQSAINHNSKDQRDELTLQIEITAELTSPESEQAQRNQVQMAMLSARLEQGQEFTLADLLEKWLSAGMFEQADLSLLNRIKPAYL